MKAFKSIFVCISIILFIVLIHTSLWAQEGDINTIQFKDGTVITGVVVKMNNEIIRIKTSNGEIVTRKFDDIVSVLGEKEIKESKAVPDTWKNKFAIGARIGCIFYEGDSFTSADGTNVDIDIDNAFIYGVNVAYFVNKYFSMELDVSRTNEVDADVNALGVGIEVGNLTITPVTLTALVHIPTGTVFYPYIGGGLGYYFTDFDRNDVSWWNASDKLDLDDCFGYHVNLGTDVFVNDAKSIALNLDPILSGTIIAFFEAIDGREV